MTLWGDGTGYWFLSLELHGKEVTLSIGPYKRSALTTELGMPYADPKHPGAVSLKEAECKGKVQVWNEFGQWYMEIMIGSNMKSFKIEDGEEKIDKLLAIGIYQKSS